MSPRIDDLGEALASIPEAHMSRRGFVGGLVGGAMVLAIPFGTAKARAASGGGNIGAFLRIGTDETITIVTPAAEMGQGVAGSLPQLIADELMVDWAKVRVKLADSNDAFTNKLFGSQGTAGSTSIRAFFDTLPKVGAQAREMLIAAAMSDSTINGLGGGTRGDYSAESGVVRNTKTGKSATYGQLAADAATKPVPSSPPLLAKDSPRFVGKSMPRLDIPAKVDGSAVFGIDVRLPGMLHGAVKLAPKVGQTLKSVGRTPTGFTVVRLKDGNGKEIGIAAFGNRTTWDAMRAVNSIGCTWADASFTATQDSAKLRANAQALMASGTAVTDKDKGAAKAAIAAAAKKISATYSAPVLAHATMEPLNATAQVVAGRSCELWAPTQNPSWAANAAKAVTGLSDSQITVHQTYIGGGFGRKFEADFVSFAVQAAAAAGGAPVKITWSREQDFTHDMYRPASLASFSGGLDADGNPVGIASRTVSQSIYAGRGWLAPGGEDGSAIEGQLMNDGDESVAYSLGNHQFAEWVQDTTSKLPLGFWRSVGRSYNVFFLESFIDELALAAGKDPLAFRKAMLPSGSRELAVLQRLESESGWSSKSPAGTGRGVAITRAFGGTTCAQVAEVTGSIASGIRVTKVTAVIDCGTVVNPDTVKSQVEGGIIQGMAAAMWQEMPFSNGAPARSNFGSYPMMRMSVAPRTINVIVMPGNGNAPSGVGEPGLPPIAPAIANAIASLTKTRLRSMPFFPSARIGGGDD